jgi:hypothetical protein
MDRAQMTDLNIFFVADGARLEWQSWLLAASLARAHDGQKGVHFFAYMGEDWLPQVSPVTLSIYRIAGVELRALPKSPGWAKPYPHGNKIVAATDNRGPGCGLFLDTDMVCLKPLTDLRALSVGQIAAAPEGRATWGTNDRWARAYDHFALPFPDARIRLLRDTQDDHVPYFNAGLVAFPEAEGTGADGFAKRWLETAMNFDHHCKIANKRPWLDQITLPLTIARFGYTAHVLGESHNYSLSYRGDYAQTPDVHVLHYHRSRFLEAAPQWPGIRDDFFALLPQSDHALATEGLRTLGLNV